MCIIALKPALRFLPVLLGGLLPWWGRADWPMLRGGPQHTGFVPRELKPPFQLAWASEFEGERLGTAMEPIVAEGRVFVATHQGSLYALDAASGQARWRFAAQGAFLHSPAFAEGRVIAASVDGNLYALEARTGRPIWQLFADPAGCSAAPTIAGQSIFIGTRGGNLLAVSLGTGKLRWRARFGVPIRQTAAVADERVYVTAEDLRVWCLEAGSGDAIWVSESLVGQTARDYYPVVVKAGERTFVIVRTNPVINMAQLLAHDRTLLSKIAGADDSTWQKLDAWIKSDAAQGTPELWVREQQALTEHLSSHREKHTCFVLDAATGKPALTAPVLWIAGCQGVGAPPTLTADGRLLVFYRSAFGNWNRGVAPLVTLGLFDLAHNLITPLFHRNGRQPPWNTFWGTADESQNFVVVGNTALIVHQGTLSGFDLASGELFPIRGERDTYGGFGNPAWARNEWHGPGRGGVAVDGNRLYWLTGSRVLCLAAETEGPVAGVTRISAKTTPTHIATNRPGWGKREIENRLVETTEELLWQRWAPLMVEPGLAGRDFSFDHSGEVFAALAWAYPHLPRKLQDRTKAFLAAEWTNRPPWTREAWYPLKEGLRRERFWPPEEVLSRLGQDRPPHPFGNLYAVGLYAKRCGERHAALACWSQLKTVFAAFRQTGWKLDGARGDLYANRYLASLLACAELATQAGDTETATQATAQAATTTEALVAWWRRAAEQAPFTSFNGSNELDPFIGSGDALSFRISPHRHKIALFRDLTPEVAALVKAGAPEAVARVWATFQSLYATWPLMGEERQVHSGENFVDPPDLAMGAFQALAWLKDAPRSELATRLDIPFCWADLNYLTKLALALEAKAP